MIAFPRAKVCDAYSYYNAQCFPEKRDMQREPGVYCFSMDTFLSPESIVHLYSEDIILILHERSVRVEELRKPRRSREPRSDAVGGSGAYRDAP